jgi:PAS domain S-box-containing protein
MAPAVLRGDAHTLSNGTTSEDFMSMVLDRTTDGVMLADGNGTIVHANVPLLQLFGYEAEDLIGQPLEILLPANLRSRHRTHVKGFVAAPTSRPMGREDLDLVGRHADGSLFCIDVQLNPLPGSTLVVVTIRDMTSQRHATADLAICKIDLANAGAQLARLEGALDLVIQGLFALGATIAAGASNESVLSERMASALHRIDQVIEAVQSGRQAVGP